MELLYLVIGVLVLVALIKFVWKFAVAVIFILAVAFALGAFDNIATAQEAPKQSLLQSIFGKMEAPGTHHVIMESADPAERARQEARERQLNAEAQREREQNEYYREHPREAQADMMDGYHQAWLRQCERLKQKDPTMDCRVSASRYDGD